MTNNKWNETVNNVLVVNTAQSVLNHLKALESNRAHMRTRWIWELLQNARDTSADVYTHLVASVELGQEELVFQHNGPEFNMEEIAHLIYHGSTKIENEAAIGQYGSGFLTTHLLSPTIYVSGQLDDGQSFEFRLKREVGSDKELSDSMKRAGDDFNRSLYRRPTIDSLPTRFRYPIGEDSADAVEHGLATLKRCAPLVVAFNREFSSIKIKSPGETTIFNVTGRDKLEPEGLQQVTVIETTNGNPRETKYLLAQGDRATVAIPVESVDNDTEVEPIIWTGSGRSYVRIPALLPVIRSPLPVNPSFH